MKIISRVLFIAITCFALSSCNKNKTSNVTGTFTAKIDGAAFTGDKLVAATKALNVIVIGAQSNDGGQIVLRVADSGVHKYTLDLNSSSNIGAYSIGTDYSYATNQGNNSSESGGTLSITSIDATNKKMSGTFSMEVYRQLDATQKNITEGTFTNVSYNTQALPPANATDTFRVKADGVQFSVSSITGVSAFNMINISASNADISKTVGLSFPSTITTGTYTFSSFNPNYIGQYNVGSSYMGASSGTLTILEHNTSTKRIRGNFNFQASEILGSTTATLTEGYFSVVYQ